MNEVRPTPVRPISALTRRDGMGGERKDAIPTIAEVKIECTWPWKQIRQLQLSAKARRTSVFTEINQKTVNLAHTFKR